MVHHLEAGSCAVAYTMSRDEIYRFVRAKDPNGIIAKKLIGWNGEASYEVSARTWDGTCYRCYLCTRGFDALQSLRAHINSNTRKYPPCLPFLLSPLTTSNDHRRGEPRPEIKRTSH